MSSNIVPFQRRQAEPLGMVMLPVYPIRPGQPFAEPMGDIYTPRHRRPFPRSIAKDATCVLETEATRWFLRENEGGPGDCGPEPMLMVDLGDGLFVIGTLEGERSYYQTLSIIAGLPPGDKRQQVRLNEVEWNVGNIVATQAR